MQQSVIVHREKISRSGEMKYFQIPLPGTEKKIIGVETSIFLLTALPAPPVAPPDSGGGTSTGAPTPGCPNPGTATITETDNQVSGLTRTQFYKIGAAVNPGFKYSVAVYGVTITVTAVNGDTPAIITQNLYDAINNTTLAEWSANGSNNNNRKPFATNYEDTFTITLDSQHVFASWAEGSCTGAPPPTPVIQYDPLFTMTNSDKAGVLSLQSPDRTDIFYQGEVCRQDKNITFGDFTSKNFLETEQWVTGKKRVASEVFITTNSPMIEAYYKDLAGVLHNTDLNYQLNIFIWLEK